MEDPVIYLLYESGLFLFLSSSVLIHTCMVKLREKVKSFLQRLNILVPLSFHYGEKIAI